MFPPAKAGTVIICAEWYIDDVKYGFKAEYTPMQIAAGPLEDVINSFCFYANQEIERLISKDDENKGAGNHL